MKHLQSSYYRGCHLEPYYHSRLAGTCWRWATWVDGVGWLYADTLAGIKKLVREALAEQGKAREEM